MFERQICEFMGFLTQGKKEKRKNLMDYKEKILIEIRYANICSKCSYILHKKNNKWITDEKEARSKGNVKQKQSCSSLKSKLLHNKALSPGLSV